MSAGYKRRRALPKDFVSLIFNKEQITLSDCIPVFDELERNPESLSRLFSDEENFLQLLSNFDQYASRISRFFATFKKHAVNYPIDTTRQKPWLGPAFANELTERILLPLLGEDFSQFSLGNSFLDAFSAVLDCCLPHSPRSFEKLAGRLFKEKSVFAALISGAGGGIVKQWIVLFADMIRDYQTLQEWTRRLIEQCDSCRGDHDIDQPKQRWQALDSILPRLIRALRNHPRPTADAPWQLLPLRLDSDLTLTLQRFGISPPSSERSLEAAIFTLERVETVRMLKAASESFPCRHCYESFTGRESIEFDQDQRERCLTLDFGHFADYLGPRIGMWRVLASSEALEDMQQVYQEGSFEMVEPVITQLASGMWDDPPIRQRLGGISSFLYLAPYGQDQRSGILWELDVEFDEAEDTLSQLIRIWRIGEIRSIEQAEPHIRLIHKTFTEVRRDAHRQFSVDQASGIAYPNSYGRDSNTLKGTVELDDKSQEQLAESILRFNRFYSVTQTTLKNIRAENLTAEYPLNLAKEELEVVKDTSNSTLIMGRSGTGKTTCLVYKLLGRYLASRNSDATNPPRQVLLTRSHVLSNKLKDYTKRLIATHTSEPLSSGEGTDRVHIMLGDDEREVNHTIFTMLADDFPLVCTFNHFLKLLENTLRASDRKDFSFYPDQGGPMRDTESKKKETGRRLYRKSQVVDFEVFSEQYWEQFPANLIKGVSPTLAFMEIIGVIKGSACRSIDFQPLTRERYLQEGRSISPIDVDRDHMYDIYLRYEKIKRDHGDIDDIDRARDVLNGMAKNRDVKNRIERAFDEIYIDEIQDQRLLEIMMLLHLIKAPNAVHFAGDTAQSISKDSVFRFQNIKDLLYARFSSGKKISPYVHRLFKNYRTHQGILNVATSVMGLLCGRFPEMVDHMEDEEGQFSGPKPVLFVGIGSEVLSSNMFGATNLAADPAQFGADQVIIVRDKAQQDKVRKEIGDFALVLTVLDSKGMEFEDVLLLDFFSTSKCLSAWRAAQSADFDPIKHLAFCSELKQLYVAITRAQYRLWFFESNPASVKDILKLWKPDVDIVQQSDSNKRERLKQLRPGKNANPEIWSRRGYQFIDNKNYESALLCFRRADDRIGNNLTRALIAERKAKALLARGDEDPSEIQFREAAKLFRECGEELREASCYEALGEFEEAGDIFAKNKQFSRAADLYVRADMFEKAANSFVEAGRYNEGASVLSRGHRFDSLVLYLNRHSSALSPAYQRHYARLCILLIRRGKISSELRELATSALSDAEKEEFFRGYEMKEQLLKLLIEQGRYSDACRDAITFGDLAEAWKIGEEYGGMEQLQPSDKIEVYNHRQVEALHESLSSRATQLFISEPASIPQCSWLSDMPSITRFWRNLPHQLSGFWRHWITYESLTFAEPWMKEIFDLIVTLKADTFIKSANSVTELPVESIATAVAMTKSLVLDSNIPTTLLTLLGVIPCRKRADEFVVLQPSPLLDNDNGLTGQKSKVLVEPAIARWIVTHLCQAVSELCKTSGDILYKSKPCLTFQYRGYCHNECKLSHNPPMKGSDYITNTKNLLRMASIIYSLLPLYYDRGRFNNLAPRSFLHDFRGYQRGAMERLIAGITYISAVEQSPEILKRIWDEITEQNSAHIGVQGGLAELLFYRLRRPKELDKICDISSMLEQLEIAQSLGLRSNFESNLAFSARKRRYHRPQYYHASGSHPNVDNNLEPSEENKDKAWESWKTLQTISCSLLSGIGQQEIDALDKVIQDADSIDIRSYHAIVALYEKWATYLIYHSNPREVLLPQAWISLYKQMLPQAVPAFNTAILTRTRQDLLLLVESFCSLLQKINDDEEFQHKFLGLVRAKGQGIRIFARRNVHFLVTCILNIHSWKTGPISSYLQSRYIQVSNLVDQKLLLRFAKSPELRDRTSSVNLCRSYLESFNIYSGKDGPRIVTATKDGPTFFSSLQPMVPRVSLAELTSVAASEETTIEQPDHDDAVHSFQDYSHVEPSVIIIQKMWRSRYPVVMKRRAFFSSAQGVALTLIEGICSNLVDVPVLGRKESVRVRSLLFTVGLELHVLAEKVNRIYKESRDKAKSIMKDGKMSGIESAQIWWEKLSKMQGEVIENTNFFSERNWHTLRQIDSNELEIRIQKVHKYLHHIELSLNLLNPQKRRPAAATIIQRTFRTQRHKLKLRREFRTTETGKTIAYVKRIVVALSIRDPLDRIGEIRRAWVLFNHVAQLIQKVKEIETIYKKTKRAVRFRMNWADAEEKRRAHVLSFEVNEIRETVRKEASFLSETNWMELNIPSSDLEVKCKETGRVMRTVENALFRIMYQ